MSDSPRDNGTYCFPLINSFRPNGISTSYQFNQSISILGFFGWYLSIYSNLNRAYCKQIVKTLIRRHLLICVCTGCLCPTKRTLGLYGLNERTQLLKCTRGIVFGLSRYLLIYAMNCLILFLFHTVMNS